MLECQHCQKPNYDTLLPAGCLLWGAALQLTQLHSTGACGVTSCSQMHNTLRLCDSVTPISSSLFLTSCQACARDPGFPPFANTSLPPCSLLSIIDFRYFWYMGKGGRGRASSALFQSIAIEWEEKGCSGCVLGNWLIHPPIKPRGPCGGAV